MLTCWLHDHCTGRHRCPGWLPVVLLLWANLHPGVIIGQALLLGAIGWEWLNRWACALTRRWTAAPYSLAWMAA